MPRAAIAILASLLVAGFGGCIEMEGLSRIPPPLVPEPNLPKYDPVDGASPVRLYLAGPSDPSAVAASRTEVSFVLWDSESHSLVAQAVAELGASSSGVQAPPRSLAPERSTGLYVGNVSLDAAGEWILEVAVTPAKGAPVSFAIPAVIAPPPGPLQFDTFAAALAAPGTDLVLANADALTQTHDFSADGVTAISQLGPAAHEATYGFAVGPLSSHLEAEINLDSMGAPGELMVELVDPSGATAATATISAAAPTATLAVAAPVAGDWQMRVSGDAVGSAYEATLGVHYGVAARLLDPAGPARAGESPVVLLVYDPIRNATVDGAAVRLVATSARGTGSAALTEDASVSTYTGLLPFPGGARWQLDASVGIGGLDFRLTGIVASG